jgi:hypothetical protein
MLHKKQKSPWVPMLIDMRMPVRVHRRSDSEGDARLVGDTSANALTWLPTCLSEYEGATEFMTL